MAAFWRNALCGMQRQIVALVHLGPGQIQKPLCVSFIRVLGKEGWNQRFGVDL